MLDSGRTDREESHVTDVKIREKCESSIRLKGKSRSTAAVDSDGDRAMKRKASLQLRASSGVDTRVAKNKHAKFDLRDLREHSHEVLWDAEAWTDRSITNNGEGEEIHERDGRDLPRDAPKT